MAEALVKVESISKKFCRDLGRSLVYGVQDLCHEFLGLEKKAEQLREGEFWAVRDVSFELKRGEAVGIIGRNGAGKTTLLRMLNGLLKPDSGKIHMRGRIAALIQLGAGFNPIMTGRENIYINAAVMGIPEREIRRNLDRIVDFAELGEFIDAPVQSYSSGMKVRLGFSVITNLKPDILLIDEVLTVGDISFRNKCADVIADLKQSGTIFIFVSHGLNHVSRLCDKVMLLKKGCVAASGATDEVISHYVTDAFDHSPKYLHLPGSEKFVDIRDVSLLNGFGQPVEQIETGQSLTVRVEFEAKVPMNQPHFAFFFDLAARQMTIATLSQSLTNDRPSFENGVHTVEVRIPRVPFLPGVYPLRLSVSSQDLIGLFGKVQDLAVIKVVPNKEQFVQSNQGAFVELEANWDFLSLNAPKVEATT